MSHNLQVPEASWDPPKERLSSPVKPSNTRQTGEGVRDLALISWKGGEGSIWHG